MKTVKKQPLLYHIYPHNTIWYILYTQNNNILYTSKKVSCTHIFFLYKICSDLYANANIPNIPHSLYYYENIFLNFPTINP